jgi:hypothetical protein
MTTKFSHWASQQLQILPMDNVDDPCGIPMTSAVHPAHRLSHQLCFSKKFGRGVQCPLAANSQAKAMGTCLVRSSGVLGYLMVHFPQHQQNLWIAGSENLPYLDKHWFLWECCQGTLL